MVDRPNQEAKTLDTDSMEDYTEDVIKILHECKPDWEPDCKPIDCCGHDFVAESIFVFRDCGYFWITKLCGKKCFAYKKVSADWIKYYANLILLSPVVFVEFDKCRHIRSWQVSQCKKCPHKGHYPDNEYNPVLAI